MIAPSAPFTVLATPFEPWAPLPTPPLNFLPAPWVHTPFAAAPRYFWKLSVVPDSSDRETTWIGLSGRFRLSLPLTPLIAGSFHLVMPPLKIFAITVGVRASLSTPESL